MPLEPGKGAVGRNISELEKAGHPKAQSTAIALKEAGMNKDEPKNVQARATLPGTTAAQMHGDAEPGGYTQAVPGLTLADIQAKNSALWEPEKQPSAVTMQSESAPEPGNPPQPSVDATIGEKRKAAMEALRVKIAKAVQEGNGGVEKELRRELLRLAMVAREQA